MSHKTALWTFIACYLDFADIVDTYSCWDGVNLDSTDHKSHVAYSQGGGGATGGGNCPSSHPVKVPQIMYEIMWNVTEFSDRSQWPTDSRRPFVYAMNLGYVQPSGSSRLRS